MEKQFDLNENTIPKEIEELNIECMTAYVVQTGEMVTDDQIKMSLFATQFYMNKIKEAVKIL